jgi:hypothetical protein
MTGSLPGIFVLLLLTLSFWGWGHYAARHFYGPTFVGWFYPVVLGMAVACVIGGVGNALGIATPFFLWAIIVSGALLAVPALRHFRVDHAEMPWFLLVTGSSLAILVFLGATLLPSSLFNYHDDFHTYLARPIRMLQTGTLAGGWFDLLGWDSLGGQAFFQGFLLLALPIEYIHGLDAVLCFALAVALAGELARRLDVHVLFAITAMVILITMNPMIVNVSTVYTGAVLIQGTLLAALLWHDAMSAQTARVPWRPAIAVGLFLAALATLKLTLALYSAMFFLLWMLGNLIFYRERMRVAISSVLVVMLAALAAIAPWLMLHREHLLTALTRLLGGPHENTGGGGLGLARLLDLFRYWNYPINPYGGKHYYYSLVVSGLLAAGIVALVLIWRRTKSSSSAYRIPVFAAGISSTLVYLIFPIQIDSTTAIRYASPILIALVPFVVAASGRSLRKRTESPYTFFGVTVPIAITCTTFLASATLLFGAILQKRFDTLLEKRTLIAHPISTEDIRYSAYALGPPAKQSVRQAQDVTEPGAGILSHISQSFHLDFVRNPILAAYNTALLAPWFDMPLDAGTDTIRRFLLDRGIKYIIWEQAGFGTTDIGQLGHFLSHPHPFYKRYAHQALSFHGTLMRLTDNSAVIYRNNDLLVLRLSEHSPTR